MKQIAILGITIILVINTFAATTFRTDLDAIHVRDWPEDCPCTAEQLLLADKIYGWNKVSHNKETDTYTVSADLIIGSNDGTNTFFNLSKGESLIVKGNIVVFPYWIANRNAKDDRYLKKAVNRLTLDSATIKIANGKSIFIGTLPKTYQHKRLGRVTGGQLLANNSTITALTDRFGSPHMYTKGDRVEIRNSVISKVRGVALFGLDATLSNAIMDNVTVENCGYALINKQQRARNCTFRNLRTAVLDWGGVIEARLENCVFENNNQNIVLRRGWIECIDCDFGKAAKPDTVNAQYAPKDSFSKKTIYPKLSSLRHIIVQVIDKDTGKPIQGATVSVSCPQQTGVAFNSKQITDNQGKTPGKGEENAILLTEYIKTATEKLEQPQKTTFKYTIKVDAKGYRTTLLEGVTPTESWHVFQLTLSNLGKQKLRMKNAE